MPVQNVQFYCVLQKNSFQVGVNDQQTRAFMCVISVVLNSMNLSDAKHHCFVILWLQLRFDPFRSVGILGFNSPEWLISNMAAIFAGFVCAF